MRIGVLGTGQADAFVSLVPGMGVNLTLPREGLVGIRIARAAAESIRGGSVDVDRD